MAWAWAAGIAKRPGVSARTKTVWWCTPADALCGGLAMAIHGYPRATVDIDVLAPAEQLPRLLEAVRPLGYDIAHLRGDEP